MLWAFHTMDPAVVPAPSGSLVEGSSRGFANLALLHTSGRQFLRVSSSATGRVKHTGTSSGRHWCFLRGVLPGPCGLIIPEPQARRRLQRRSTTTRDGRSTWFISVRAFHHYQFQSKSGLTHLERRRFPVSATGLRPG